ncbi:MAG: PAS domain S-box protein [Mariniphaga sp.]|nr:PAS domain S-box protein [Mariniphaga sp.]
MKKILVIDDKKDNLTTIEALLKIKLPGCKILTALSGKEGIEIANKEQPDTILLDIIMPGMDGYEVCKRLKENESTKHIPVVMITAIKTDPESRIKGLDMGADAFLSKPIDQGELSAQVNVMLRIKKAEDELRAEKKYLKKLVDERTGELMESEDKFRLISKNTSDFISITGLDGKYIYVSPSYNLLGYNPEELIGKDGFDILHPEDMKRMLPMLKQVISGFFKKGTTKRFEIRLRNKSGKYLYTESIVKLIKDNTGKFQILSIVRDITERKLAEKIFQKNQYYLSKAQEIGKIGTWELDLIKNELIWTDQNYQNFGVPTGTPLTYEIFLNCVHPDDRDFVNSKWMEALTGKPYDIEHRLVVDNKVRWVREKANAEFDTKGNPIMAIGFTQDITVRKQTEQALQLTQFSVDNLTDAVYWFGPDAKFIYVNEAAVEALGYTKKELLTMTVHDIGPDFPEEVWPAHWAELKEKKSYLIQTFHQRKDQSTFPVEITVNFVQFGGEEINYAIAKDITERRKAEKNLKESELKFRLLAEFTYDWEYWIDQDGKYIYLSPSCERITGYSPKDFYNNPELLFDLVHPDYAKKVYSHYSKKAEDQKSIFNFEFLIINSSGNLRWLEHNCTPVFDNQGNFMGRRGNNRDITERKKTEEKLKESEERFKSLMQQSPFVVELYDLKGLQISVNKAYEELWNFPAKTTLNKFNVLKSKEVVDTGLIKYINRAYAGESVTVPEYIFDPTGNTEAKGVGRIRWLSTRIYPLKDKSGKVKNIVIVHQDITDRKKAEDELIKHREHLEELVKERTKELEEKNEDLERFNELFVGREFRIKELKDKVKELEEKLKLNL